MEGSEGARYISEIAANVKVEKTENYPSSAPFAEKDKNIEIASIGPEKTKKSIKVGPLRLPVKEEEATIDRVSRFHGRALTHEFINNNVLWGGDLPGDIFGSRDYKGLSMAIDLDNPLFVDRNSGYGYSVKGLKDNLGIMRIERASDFLRKNGLPTEKIVRESTLKEVWVKSGSNEVVKISIETFKKEVLKRIWGSAQVERKNGDFYSAQTLEKKWRDIKDYFESTNFYAVTRDLQTAERLTDIAHPTSMDKFRKNISSVFKWINTACAAKGSGIIPNTEKPEPFNNNEDDIKRYLSEWLPKQMGIYLARTHNLNLTHNFPHEQNWSAVGTLYDLDSLCGIPLGDKIDDDALEQQKYMDCSNTLSALERSLPPDTPFGNDIAKLYPEVFEKAIESFLVAYIKERWGKQQLINSKFISKIESKYIWQIPFPNVSDKFANNELKSKIVAKLRASLTENQKLESPNKL